MSKYEKAISLYNKSIKCNNKNFNAFNNKGIY